MHALFISMVKLPFQHMVHDRFAGISGMKVAKHHSATWSQETKDKVQNLHNKVVRKIINQPYTVDKILRLYGKVALS